jgi:hypothetical protein
MTTPVPREGDSDGDDDDVPRNGEGNEDDDVPRDGDGVGNDDDAVPCKGDGTGDDATRIVRGDNVGEDDNDAHTVQGRGRRHRCRRHRCCIVQGRWCRRRRGPYMYVCLLTWIPFQALTVWRCSMWKAKVRAVAEAEQVCLAVGTAWLLHHTHSCLRPPIVLTPTHLFHLVFASVCAVCVAVGPLNIISAASAAIRADAGPIFTLLKSLIQVVLKCRYFKV